MRIATLSVVLCAVALAGCGTQKVESVSSPPPPPPTPTSAAVTSSTIGSCIEKYSIDNVKKRAYAFDGVVRNIERGSEPNPDRVTFDVREWFKGGSGNTAVRRATGFTFMTSAGGSPHAVGQRLLVTGDEDFVWECGFTQPYDERVAADWRAAFKS